MISRIIIISLLFLSGCATANQGEPFDISTNIIKSEGSSLHYDIFFRLRNTTSNALEIDISTLSIDSIEFEFFDNKERKVNLKQFSPIEDYIKKTITIKPNTFFEKKIPLTSYYPELINKLKTQDLDLLWSSQIIVYKTKDKYDLFKKLDVKDRILLTKIQ